MTYLLIASILFTHSAVPSLLAKWKDEKERLDCNIKDIIIKEKGKLLGVEKINDIRFVYYIHKNGKPETDLGDTFIRVINCENDIIFSVKILDNDIVEAFNKHILMVANNDLQEAVSEAVINVYDVITGKKIKILNLKLDPGDRLNEIICLEDQSYIQILDKNGILKAIKIFNNHKHTLADLKIPNMKTATIKKDINEKNIFFVNNKNEVVGFVNKKPIQPFIYIDDWGNKINYDLINSSLPVYK